MYLVSSLAREFVSFLILCMHSYRFVFLYLVAYIPLLPDPSTSISSTSGMQERAETLLKAMKVEKSLLEVPRWQRFCWNSVLIGSWKLWKLNEAEGPVEIYFVLWWDSECYIHLYIDVYIDTLDGDKIIPHDARQIILRAFFIWRSMMSFHYPLISLDNFCISGGGVCWGFTTRGVAFLNRASRYMRILMLTSQCEPCTAQEQLSTAQTQARIAKEEWPPGKTAGNESPLRKRGFFTPVQLLWSWENLWPKKGKNTAGIGYCLTRMPHRKAVWEKPPKVRISLPALFGFWGFTERWRISRLFLEGNGRKISCLAFVTITLNISSTKKTLANLMILLDKILHHQRRWLSHY